MMMMIMKIIFNVSCIIKHIMYVQKFENQYKKWETNLKRNQID